MEYAHAKNEVKKKTFHRTKKNIYALTNFILFQNILYLISVKYE